MVVHHKHPVYTLLISLTLLAFIYLTLINITINQNLPKPRNFDRNVKKIVAYSLLKRIEIESEYYNCDGRLNTSQINYDTINVSVGADNDNGTVDGENYEDETWTNIDGSQLNVFSIHLDRRLDPHYYIRIIGMIRGSSYENFYCQILSNNTLHVLKVTITSLWLDIWDQNDTNIYFNPVLLSCKLPFGLVPKTVSITTKPCDVERKKDFLIVDNSEERMHTFTVCVKPLNFLEDISNRLIQWIEISRVLGAEKIEIYVKKVKKNVWKILKWYSSIYPRQIILKKFKNIVNKTLSKTNYNFSRTLWQKRRYEVITYNSCFYRNIQTSQFIIPLDIDEILLPRHVFSWQEVLENIPNEVKHNFASYMVPNTYFFGELESKKTSKVFFLVNDMRTSFSPPGESGKSFISTKNSLAVFNHYALDVLKPGVSRTYFLPSDVIQLNHYKENCNSVILPECVNYVSSPRIKDVTIFKYETVFKNRYSSRIKLLQQLGFIL